MSKYRLQTENLNISRSWWEENVTLVCLWKQRSLSFSFLFYFLKQYIKKILSEISPMQYFPLFPSARLLSLLRSQTSPWSRSSHHNESRSLTHLLPLLTTVCSSQNWKFPLKNSPSRFLFRHAFIEVFRGQNRGWILSSDIYDIWKYFQNVSSCGGKTLWWELAVWCEIIHRFYCEVYRFSCFTLRVQGGSGAGLKGHIGF